MKAIVIPYSSVVGGGIVLKSDDSEMPKAMLSIHSVTLPDGETNKSQSEKIAKYIAQLVNDVTLEDGQPY